MRLPGPSAIGRVAAGPFGPGSGLRASVAGGSDRAASPLPARVESVPAAVASAAAAGPRKSPGCGREPPGDPPARRGVRRRHRRRRRGTRPARGLRATRWPPGTAPSGRVEMMSSLQPPGSRRPRTGTGADPHRETCSVQGENPTRIFRSKGISSGLRASPSPGSREFRERPGARTAGRARLGRTPSRVRRSDGRCPMPRPPPRARGRRRGGA